MLKCHSCEKVVQNCVAVQQLPSLIARCEKLNLSFPRQNAQHSKTSESHKNKDNKSHYSTGRGGEITRENRKRKSRQQLADQVRMPGFELTRNWKQKQSILKYTESSRHRTHEEI
ncbi:hypothetical protein CEXT_588451 [Caerostris extrusa]|uniref:Uncharacterized protein n=1 Tax=Caerostris extrusa TaxID=172846 RepID=A0AAV4UB85_CAEEX|nr:hypothetical protein CEXT_588451 [Caerostris extrusa]